MPASSTTPTAATPLMRIDAHLHLWDRTRLDYPWMAELPQLPQLSSPDVSGQLDSYSDIGPGFGAIIIEAGVEKDQTGAEVAWLSQLSGLYPWIQGIVAAIDLTVDRLGELLADLRSNPLIVGVRDNLEGRPPGDLDIATGTQAGVLQAGIETVLAAGFTFDLCVRADQLGELRPLLGAIIESRGSASGIVIDHLGKPLPEVGADVFNEWRANILSLAGLPGLHIKFSGLPGQIPGEVDAARASELTNTYAPVVIAAFGPKRSMFGSDHPVSTLGHGLSESDWRQAVDDAVRDCVDDDGLAAVMGATAAQFYGLRSES